MDLTEEDKNTISKSLVNDYIMRQSGDDPHSVLAGKLNVSRNEAKTKLYKYLYSLNILEDEWQK